MPVPHVAATTSIRRLHARLRRLIAPLGVVTFVALGTAL
jgi:hypothetical protein